MIYFKIMIFFSNFNSDSAFFRSIDSDSNYNTTIFYELFMNQNTNNKNFQQYKKT